MTLSADIAFEEYTIVDADAPLSFPHPWEFNDEIVVFEDGVLLDIGTDYSLTGAGAPGGGQINPVAATLASRWTAYRFTRLAQTSVPSDAVVGFALDRLTRAIQDARRDSDRSLKIDDENVLDIPVPIQPGKPLIGNATADGFAYGTSSVDADLAALEAQINSVASDLDTEEATRISQDGALSDMIVAETVARTSAISNEATARATQDDILMGLILADGGLSDPEDLQVYLGLDVTNASLTTAQGDITTLQSEMNTAQGDITTLQSEMNTAQADIDAAEAAIALKLDASAVSAYILTLLNDADASAAQTTLGISAFVKTLLDDADAAAARITLGVDSAYNDVKVTIFLASGTFTPDPKMVECEIWAWGGGGGGGGAAATGGATISVGGGGAAGAKVYLHTGPVTIGASKAVVIGAGGTGVAGTAGNPGGDTTLGAIFTAKGGSAGGTGGPGGASFHGGMGATAASTGSGVLGWTVMGEAGSCLSVTYKGGNGGQNEWGGGGVGSTQLVATNGNNGGGGNGTGAGGAGAGNGFSQAARPGGAGVAGLMIIKEYLKL